MGVGKRWGLREVAVLHRAVWGMGSMEGLGTALNGGTALGVSPMIKTSLVSRGAQVGVKVGFYVW